MMRLLASYSNSYVLTEQAYEAMNPCHKQAKGHYGYIIYRAVFGFCPALIVEAARRRI